MLSLYGSVSSELEASMQYTSYLVERAVKRDFEALLRAGAELRQQGVKGEKILRFCALVPCIMDMFEHRS